MVAKPQKVILLGSSALKIGEAGEFDYSGSQAIKALKQEGVETVLINPNIATIQTSEHLADKVYFLPVTPEFVARVIEKERPEGMLLGFGGQTALNCGLELHRSRVLEQYGVRILGTPVETILDTEDRDRFTHRLSEIGVATPRSFAATSPEEAVKRAKELGFPVILRSGFSLGGLGSGVCRTPAEVRALAEKALSLIPQVLVEEYLEGWKEVEYEVVRDSYGNCVTICNMENLDPMGIHTGESIVVAPSQTLTNREYHLLRSVAVRTIQHLGIVGECNIQFALDPASEEYRVIEVNARLSRSSALASKATGYPLAFVAAKLALGYGLHELTNSVTQSTRAFFEPALDYVVVKIPRWDLKKFRMVSRRIGSGMKSVGEVMAIGRSFEEALQKAVRMLDIGVKGLVDPDAFSFGDLKKELQEPTEDRLFAVSEALRQGLSVDEVHRLTHIDRWFLYRIQNLHRLAQRLQEAGQELDVSLLREAKQAGFSDEQVAVLVHQTPEAILALRREWRLHPAVKQIDTLAAEYPARTNYLYLTYHGQEDDLNFPDEPTVLILGSGSYRIGSSVEFDWSAVNTSHTARKLGWRTAMLNFNPETVSTDYDESDYLFFDEINLETVVEVYRKCQAKGVVISVGGQLPNILARDLKRLGLHVLGTDPDNIDRAENRVKFSALLDRLGVNQPAWRQLTSLEEARSFAREVGYPVLVRPSYVLSGAAMAIASSDEELSHFLHKAADISPRFPVVISKFLENAKEIEFDGVAQDGKIVMHAISEHVENAGVHSGDATLVFPPQRTYLETVRQIRRIAAKIACALRINGPFNIQFIAKQNEVKVIECNLRASRSFPFVSKIIGRNLIEAATRILLGESVPPDDASFFEVNHVGVKAPQFSFTRLEGADPTSGVEMASTGEVACLGDDFDEAFLKALISVGYRFPIRSVLLSTGSIESKAELLESCRLLQGLGVRFYATRGTARFLRSHGIETTVLNWPLERRQPNTVDYIKSGKIDLVINIPKNYQREELTNDYIIRRTAVDYGVPLITNRQLAMRLAEALSRKSLNRLSIKHWGEYLEDGKA